MSKTGIFDVVPVIGATVAEALKVFKDAEDTFFSRIYADVDNYSRWSLNHGEYDTVRGETLEVASVVHAGYTEAWVAAQGDVTNSGTEGLAVWNTYPGRLCVIYWSVDANVAWRDGNKLGVGCTDTENKTADLEDSTKYGKLDFVNYRSFDKKQHTIQFCDGVLCIQGIMSSSYESKATISIFPINITDLAPNLADKITQDEINGIVKQGQDCKLGCSVASRLSIDIQVLVALLFTVYMAL